MPTLEARTKEQTIIYTSSLNLLMFQQSVTHSDTHIFKQQFRLIGTAFRLWTELEHRN